MLRMLMVSAIMLSVAIKPIMPCFVILNVGMLSVVIEPIMLSVIKLNVLIVIAVAP